MEDDEPIRRRGRQSDLLETFREWKNTKQDHLKNLFKKYRPSFSPDWSALRFTPFFKNSLQLINAESIFYFSLQQKTLYTKKKTFPSNVIPFPSSSKHLKEKNNHEDPRKKKEKKERESSVLKYRKFLEPAWNSLLQILKIKEHQDLDKKNLDKQILDKDILNRLVQRMEINNSLKRQEENQRAWCAVATDIFFLFLQELHLQSDHVPILSSTLWALRDKILPAVLHLPEKMWKEGTSEDIAAALAVRLLDTLAWYEHLTNSWNTDEDKERSRHAALFPRPTKESLTHWLRAEKKTWRLSYR